MKLRMVAACILCTLLFGASSAFAELLENVKTGGSEANMANWSAYYYGQFEVGPDIKWSDTARRDAKAREIAANGYNNLTATYKNGETATHYKGNTASKTGQDDKTGDAYGMRNYGSNNFTMIKGEDWFSSPPTADIIGVWNGESENHAGHNDNQHSASNQVDSYNLGGFYAFVYDFTLDSLTKGVEITGNFWMDNAVLAVQLVDASGNNLAWWSWVEGDGTGSIGKTQPPGESFNAIHSLGNGDLDVLDMEAGKYSLVFYGMNGYTRSDKPEDVAWTCGPLGFAADLQITGSSNANQSGDATPEPATLLMLGLGGLVLPLSRRFRKK